MTVPPADPEKAERFRKLNREQERTDRLAVRVLFVSPVLGVVAFHMLGTDTQVGWGLGAPLLVACLLSFAFAFSRVMEEWKNVKRGLLVALVLGTVGLVLKQVPSTETPGLADGLLGAAAVLAYMSLALFFHC